MGRIPHKFARRPWGKILPPVLLLVSFGAVLSSAAAERFPLKMKDDRGVEIRLAAPPRRVVSLAPNLTEIVFLLGKEKVLVGVTRFCNHPPAAASLPKIGGVSDPDVERIIAQSPDLVLCTTDGNPRQRVLALEEMGIPCFAVAPQDLAGVLATIERLGELLGDAGRARAETASLKGRAEKARAAAGRGGGAAPLALFVVSTSPIIVAGEGTFMDELLRLAGARNAARRFAGRYPRLSVEDLLAAQPDVIFVAGMAGVERFPPEVTGWKEIPAFRDGAVFHLDGDIVTRPGPRLVVALERIADALSSLRARNGGGR
ncbi:MAG: ABC-type transporter, periplasmic subunit [Deltaproteobacteria bacterium]|nr:ABC-type transporter, periplasmic subunit [Deltaproteobacteria bacterium]